MPIIKLPSGRRVPSEFLTYINWNGAVACSFITDQDTEWTEPNVIAEDIDKLVDRTYSSEEYFNMMQQRDDAEKDTQNVQIKYQKLQESNMRLLGDVNKLAMERDAALAAAERLKAQLSEALERSDEAELTIEVLQAGCEAISNEWEGAKQERDAARELLEAAHREIEVVRWQSDEMRKLLVECYHALDGARSDAEVEDLQFKLGLIKWEDEERDASLKGAE